MLLRLSAVEQVFDCKSSSQPLVVSSFAFLVRTTTRLNQSSSALAVAGYRLILASGWFWQMARWGVSFVGAFLANDLTGSARLVQLTGVAIWAPLLFGGVIGGVVSDRFDRRLTLIVQFLVVIPLAIGLGLLSMADRLQLWMVYPFMVTIGISWVIDMTSRRALIYDLVGAKAIDHAMSLEMLSSSTGLAMGALLGGTAIQAIGIDAAFIAVGAMLALSLGLFLMVPRAPQPKAMPSRGGGLAEVAAGFRMLKTERGLLSVLGVTAAVNMFFFSFTPLVQVVGSRLDVGPALLGLLAAMVGFGMMTGAILMLTLRPVRRGRAYVIGSSVAFTMALGFVATNSYVVTAAFLYLAAIGMGFFGATQGVLVMASVDDERRGRALGLLSMAIGVLPIGMIMLGELAEVLGVRAGIAIFVVTGAMLMTVWLSIRPEALAMQSSA
ncbi:MAG: putative MFS family arabinose efflux permease [Acidimicrobiales bacterium]|jgi:predicted MFS family arabinose efflux permease